MCILQLRKPPKLSLLALFFLAQVHGLSGLDGCTHGLSLVMEAPRLKLPLGSASKQHTASLSVQAMHMP